MVMTPARTLERRGVMFEIGILASVAASSTLSIVTNFTDTSRARLATKMEMYFNERAIDLRSRRRLAPQ